MKFISSTSKTIATAFFVTLALSTAAFASESYYGNPQPKPNNGYSYYKREVQNKAYGYAGAKAKGSYGYKGYVAPDRVYRRDEDGNDGSDASALNLVANDEDN